MTLQQLTAFAAEYTLESPGNRFPEAQALAEDFTGHRMYDPPLVGVADAADPMFLRFKEAGIVGPGHLLPADFLPGAVRVVSFFFPLTEAVRRSNALDLRWPSPPWLYARYEGHAFLQDFLRATGERLSRQGAEVAAPMLDPRFAIRDDISNWSERHVAHACGLGTFGLSRGLLTEKGAAGRICSLVTDQALPVTPRPYDRYDAYCLYCGACAAHCPPRAIDPKTGKDNGKCAAFLDAVRDKEGPRYGCGKCQVDLPCAAGIPQ